MKLSLRDKIALIYSSAGSQRSVAALVGVSHQKIGRILHAPEHGGYSPESRVLTDPGLIAAVNQAFAIHKDVTREQARIDALPYDPKVPIFAARMEFQEGPRAGIPGDRVEAQHLHWVSDSLKSQWLADMHASKKYAAVSIGSIVDLRADEIISGSSDEQRKAMAASIAKKLIAENDLSQRELNKIRGYIQTENYFSMLRYVIGLELTTYRGRLQTAYTDFDYKTPISWAFRDINTKLREKHQPAASEPGTTLADRILFQIDTRQGRDNAFRSRHPIPKPAHARKAKPGKTGKRK